MINSVEVVTSADFCAANIDKKNIYPELPEKIQGFLAGDKGYVRPELQLELRVKGLDLQTPRHNLKDRRSKKWGFWLKENGS